MASLVVRVCENVRREIGNGGPAGHFPVLRQSGRRHWSAVETTLANLVRKN